MSIFLFIFLHIAGVRSGLLCFYAIAVLGIIYYIYTEKKYVIGISLLVAFFAFPILLIAFLPSAQLKIETTLVDIKGFSDPKNANLHSLHNRLFSYKISADVWAKDWVFGSGMGNLEREIAVEYTRNYTFIHFDKWLMPHSQFLYYGAGGGILACLYFCFSFYVPLFMNHNYKNKLLLIHYIIATISFLFEATLETQVGTAYVVTFVFLPLYFAGNNRSADNT